MKIPNQDLKFRPYSETPENLEPQFEHDCASCVFLGRYRGPGHVGMAESDMDLYVCRGSTVLARVSDEPSDYSSGIHFATSKDPHSGLAEALKRALAFGYIRTVYETTDHYDFVRDWQTAEMKDKKHE